MYIELVTLTFSVIVRSYNLLKINVCISEAWQQNIIKIVRAEYKIINFNQKAITHSTE